MTGILSDVHVKPAFAVKLFLFMGLILVRGICWTRLSAEPIQLDSFRFT